jgi:hypothetical protein
MKISNSNQKLSLINLFKITSSISLVSALKMQLEMKNSMNIFRKEWNFKDS